MYCSYLGVAFGLKSFGGFRQNPFYHQVRPGNLNYPTRFPKFPKRSIFRSFLENSGLFAAKTAVDSFGEKSQFRVYNHDFTDVNISKILINSRLCSGGRLVT